MSRGTQYHLVVVLQGANLDVNLDVSNLNGEILEDFRRYRIIWKLYLPPFPTVSYMTIFSGLA